MNAMAYETWISEYRARSVTLLGRCAAATEEMAKAFPELKRIPGHVYCEWGRRAHWWCIAPDGTIVDPTASQFPGGVWEYEAWEPGMEVRVGRCMECGEDIFATPENLDEPHRGVNTTFCSDACSDAYALSVGW